MDRKVVPDTQKAFIIAAFMIAILCLAAGILIGNQLDEAWLNHLFWLQRLIVLSAITGIAVALFY
ncbi:MAG: hypothetical protein JSV01_05670 [Desulfobacterales bacterium]|nr:MAG: hypothetical protein JSV01_05670 [Desulfobacterales bacterium]